MRFPIFRSRGPRILSQTKSTGFSFTNTARVRGTLTRNALKAALAQLARRHPILVAHVIRQAEDYFFTDERARPIILQIVKRRSLETWVGEANKAMPLRTNFAKGPLCRCIWVRGTDEHELILVLDHLTVDGRSAVTVLKDLLSFIAEPDREPEPLEPVRLAELFPDAAKKAIEELLALPPNDAPQTPWFAQPSKRPRTIVPVSLSQDETRTLIERCRHHGVTVQAALLAAYLKPFAERDPNRPLRKAEVPLDMRSALTRSIGDVCANCIGLTLVEVDCGPADLWEVARSAKKSLDAVDLNDQFTRIPLIFSAVEKLPQPPTLAWEYDVSVSNVGRAGIPERYGDLELVQVFGPTFNVMKDDHKVLGVTTASGRLSGTYTSRDADAGEMERRGTELLWGMIGAPARLR